MPCHRSACTATLAFLAVSTLGTVDLTYADSMKTVDPESVGVNSQTIDALAADLRALVDDGKRAGIVSAIAKNGKLIHFQAYGHRDIENDLPMEPDTLFRIYSMTRPVTAVGLLTLYEDDRYELDDPVAEFIPEFADTPVSIKRGSTETVPQETPLTIYHLFTYTGGFGYPFDYAQEFGMTFDRVLGVDDTLENGIRNLAAIPLIDQPGAHWYYGLSGDVLGRVGEVASGQPYDELLKERIFEPLGMHDTGFAVSDTDWHRLAQAYRRGEDGQLVNATASLPVLNSYKEGKQMFSGGGGLVGTAVDYTRFGQMLLNGGKLDGVRILEADTVALMTRNHLSESQGPLAWYAAGRWTDEDPFWNYDGYGWGLSIGVRLDGGAHRVRGGKGEFRWDGLANTTFFVDPENDIVAVAMAQYLGTDQIKLELVLRRHLYPALTD